MNVIKKIFYFILHCLIGVEILILITAFPILFQNLPFNLTDYLHAVSDLNIKLFTIGEFKIDGKNSLFPIILVRYIESMKLFGLGLLLACSIAVFVSYLTFFFFKNKMHWVKNLLKAAESIPDLMLILLLQLSVIIIFKKTGIKLAQVVSVREKAVLLPVICLGVPISFYVTRILILHIEEELEKNYILQAKAKGLKFSYILNVHVIRNIIESMFGSSKTVFWSMLSTLLVIDYLFNLNGLSRTMLLGPDPFIIGCLLIFVPLFILYRVYEWVSFSNRKDNR
ncbi:ABC transporter permease subunit [Neobacillus rhizophilus]|uniref:ABC transporter permease subunit n=1 Tax=Neobacillus rhizophilus TaxID=2833579 RepID=A0A942U8X9_9BACI|nr:ABC transporter permease subunit [Neobacillus rhizophilus]MBS4214742.1 ABC transporter permease subunit [Neobacillus rhizophilus]